MKVVNDFRIILTKEEYDTLINARNLFEKINIELDNYGKSEEVCDSLESDMIDWWGTFGDIIVCK